MRAVDFEYDGRYLSDYGFTICSFDYDGGVVAVSAGSTITFTRISHNNGKRHSLSSTKYEECVSATFDICKDPDANVDQEISTEEYRSIMRWLNRHEFIKLRMIDSTCGDGDTVARCYYNASFNVERLSVGDAVYGLRLTMETDRPYGYGDTYSQTLVFSGDDTAKAVEDVSDDVGYTYPNLEITIDSAGDLVLTNEFTGSSMVVKNCSAGEVITVNGDMQIITSSLASHDIANDFNYRFLSIGNSIGNTRNDITASISCTVLLEYDPIIKDTP